MKGMNAAKNNELPLLIYRGDTFNPNFYYFSGMDISGAFLIVNGDRKTIITNELNRGLGKEFNGVFVIANDMAKEVMKRIRAAGIDGKMPARMYMKLSKSIRMKDMTDALYGIRAVKDNDEVSKMKKAVKLTKEIISAVRPKQGAREMDIAHMLLAETYKRGLEPAFDPIVATGRNSATPHAIPTKKKIEDHAIVDYGVRYEHYCADITRCFFFGTKKAKRIEEEYEKVKEIANEMIDSCGHMKKSAEVREFYLKLNRKYKLPAPVHSLGHGIGLDVHEYPRFGKKYDDEIVKTAFTVEPAAYFGSFGVRYEETLFHNGKRIVVL